VNNYKHYNPLQIAVKGFNDPTSVFVVLVYGTPVFLGNIERCTVEANKLDGAEIVNFIDQMEPFLVKARKRRCFKCKKNIGRHDKWNFQPDGRIAHRNCSNPEKY